jgi:hypothetical protein
VTTDEVMRAVARAINNGAPLGPFVGSLTSEGRDRLLTLLQEEQWKEVEREGVALWEATRKSSPPSLEELGQRLDELAALQQHQQQGDAEPHPPNMPTDEQG